MEHLLKIVEAYVVQHYDAEDGGLTEETSSGNEMDIFNDGYACGVASTLYDIAKLLGLEVEELHEQVYDWM